ncbi:MAG: aminopeptidase P family protein [Chloroflexi bacterium]|nr:aminopeptidase P family protein [Chloroflexota bacterium]
MDSRIELLCRSLPAKGLDAILVSNPYNRQYLTGFKARETDLSSSAGQVLATGQGVYLFTNPILAEQAKIETSGLELVVYEREPYVAIANAARGAGVKTLGFEPDSLTAAAFRALEQAAGKDIKLIATENAVEELRVRKDPEEITLIHKAVEITDRAFVEVTTGLTEGTTEAVLAWELEKAMRELGAEALAFDMVVGAGPNAALPHAIPSGKPIKAGEPVVIDMGARYEGYCADLTRTICIGQTSEQFRRIYDIVLRAQLAAESSIQAGQTASEADAFARRVIEDAGFGAEFNHSLGHGVGLAVHEVPRIGKDSPAVLEEGMVITVEPGIYIPGWGGVRIEDTVVVRESGIEILSQAPKEVFPV